jgi:hypothetical protein
VPATTIDTDAVDAAHKAVRADPSIQFDFPWRVVEAEQQTPEWMRSLAAGIDRFFRALGPFWQGVFWVLVALIVIVLVASFFAPVRDWLRDRLARRPSEAEPEWQPTQAAARALLAEAEALAAAGRFEAAVQLLLHRSIEDIEAWRAGLVRPSLTARDIAGVPAIPVTARGVFSRLVALTERGIFAARPLGPEDWQSARDAYRAFAL